MLTENKDISCENQQRLYFVKPFKEKNEIVYRLRLLSKELKWLCKQREAQKIFFLICINLAGTVLLLIFCRMTLSLALLAFTYISWFNFLSLLTCLLCIWVEAQHASISYTFGLMQSEVLAVFSSITLTLLGALFILKESIERLIHPEPIQLDNLGSVALIGLFLNLIVPIFAHNPPLGHILRASPSSMLQEHVADICHSLCFYVPGLRHLLLPRLNPLVLVSVAGFIFIIGDQIIVQVFNYPRGDTFAAILVAALTITTMYPLCICSAKLLLQTIPTHFSAHLDKCLREALTIDGVLEFQKENFWVLGTGIRSQSFLDSFRGLDIGGLLVTGSLHVRVRRDANEQFVLKEIQNRLKPIVPLLTVQIFKDDWTRSATTLKLLNDSALSFARSPFQKKLNEKYSSNFQLDRFVVPQFLGNNFSQNINYKKQSMPPQKIIAINAQSVSTNSDVCSTNVGLSKLTNSSEAKPNSCGLPYIERVNFSQKENRDSIFLKKDDDSSNNKDLNNSLLYTNSAPYGHYISECLKS